MRARIIALATFAALVGPRCSGNRDAAIVLDVDATASIDKSALTRLQVTVGGVTHDYPLRTPLPATLGIVTTRTGALAVEVVGVGANVALGRWSGEIVAERGKTVMRDVLLACTADGCGVVVPGGRDAGSDADARSDAVASDAADAPSRDAAPDGAAGSSGAAGLAGAGGAGGSIGAAGNTGQAGGSAAGAGGHAGSGGAAGAGGAAGTAGIGGTAGTIGAAGCGGANLQNDAANCGGCGYACVGGRQCQLGRCTPAWLPVSKTAAPSPRIRHGVAALDGIVYVTGGATVGNTGAMNDTYRYNPRTDAWTAGPALKQSRCAHVSASSGGRVHVFAGLTECSDGGAVGPGLEAFDPTTNAWAPVNAAGPPILRYNAQAVELPDGGFMIFGGSGAAFAMTATAARFRAGAWTDVSCSVTTCDPTTASGLFVLKGAQVVTWGGSGMARGAQMNLATSTWSAWPLPAGTPPKPVEYAQDATRWFVLAGSDGSDCPPTVTVRIFNQSTGVWSSDLSSAPAGIALDSSNTNETVWTGSELFTWSSLCSGTAPGVGGRYQPPAVVP